MYTTYHNAGPCFQLICPAIVLNIIGITGMIFNASVVYITLKNSWVVDHGVGLFSR